MSAASNAQGALLQAVLAAHNSVPGATRNRFIGSHPHDLSRAQLQSDKFLKSHVTEKKDGERGILTLVKAGLEHPQYAWVLTNRRNESRILHGDFTTHDVWQHCHVSEIWDGELCVRADGETQDLFWAFDCIMTAGEATVDRPFEARQMLLNSCLQNDDIVSSLHNCLKLCSKPMTQLQDLDEAALASLGVGWEGLVFYSSSETYYAKDAILRWKHPEHITIDVLVKRTRQETRSELLAWTGKNNYCFLATINMAAHPQPPEDAWTIDGGAIGEFSLADRHRHNFRRWRTDKFRPDHINKVKQLREDFKHPILLSDIRNALRSSGPLESRTSA